MSEHPKGRPCGCYCPHCSHAVLYKKGVHWCIMRGRRVKPYKARCTKGK